MQQQGPLMTTGLADSQVEAALERANRESRRSRKEPLVVIDTREQMPYRFPRAISGLLETGEYLVRGFEDQITIKLKTKTDAYSSLGRDRPRFQREMERLAEFDYAAVVVESSLPGFLSPPAFSRLSPNSAICTLLSWSVRYGVHMFFAGDRRHGNNVTRQLLTKYWLYHGGERRG